MILNIGFREESFKYKMGDAIAFSREIRPAACAKGDWCAFQVMIQSNEPFSLATSGSTSFHPRQVHMPDGSWKHHPGIRLQVEIPDLAGAGARIRPIGLIDDDDGVMKADVILNTEMVFVESGQVQPVWVETGIPEDTEPGCYHGEVRIYSHVLFEDEQLVNVLPFEIHVKNVRLPKPGDYRFHLDLWQHLSNIARKHEVDLWSDAHFQVLEGYVESLAQLGQKAVTIVASEIPWSGQACFADQDDLSNLFEYNMIKVRKDATGRFQFDFTAVSRYAGLCFKHGIDREINVFGLVNIWSFPEYGYGKIVPDFTDAIRVRYFDENGGTYRYMRTADEIRQYVQAIEQYFIHQGLSDKVCLMADEPSDAKLFQERLNAIWQFAPSFKIKTAFYHVGIAETLGNRINTFVPNLASVSTNEEFLNQLKQKYGGCFLWYICCEPPFPNTFVRSPLLESRLIGLLTAFMGYDGFLRWNYTVWPDNPRQKLVYKKTSWPAGDTNFVYPANNGEPLLSLRYKQLKRGIEDFELIGMLKDRHPDAQSILAKIWGRLLACSSIAGFNPAKGKNPQELYSLEAGDYEWARATILDALDGYAAPAND